MFFCAFTVGYGTVWLCRRRPFIRQSLQSRSCGLPCLLCLRIFLHALEGRTLCCCCNALTHYTWDVVESRGGKSCKASRALRDMFCFFPDGNFSGITVTMWLILSNVVLLVCFLESSPDTAGPFVRRALLVPLVLTVLCRRSQEGSFQRIVARFRFSRLPVPSSSRERLPRSSKKLWKDYSTWKSRKDMILFWLTCENY